VGNAGGALVTLLSHLKILLPTHVLSIGGSGLWVPPL